MPTTIKQGTSPATVRKKVNRYIKDKKKRDLKKLCGSISLSYDPLVLQKKWRNEWE